MNRRPDHIRVVTTEIFSRPSFIRDRVNEDAWVFLEFPSSPETVSFAVIDGAGTRKSLPAISEKIRAEFPKLTPAAFASQLLKMSLEEQLRSNPTCSLRGALIEANDLLRSEITRIVGSFDAEEIVQLLGQPYANDPRNVRLVLPTCVVTLARLDLKKSRLEFAHLGDTSLFEVFHNGDIIRHTRDQMGPFDLHALESVRAMQQRYSIEHFQDAVSSLEGREFIVQSGLRLNYIDNNGKTDLQKGCGAINGLPEMEDYIETGVVEVDSDQTLGFLILSDGLELLSPLHEDTLEERQRYRKIAQTVREWGLHGLYYKVEEMTSSDISLDVYPRTKLQDDATGVYLEVGRVSG
jgi:hypothetical protein